MYKVGVVGHTPDVFGQAADRRVQGALDTLSFQYGEGLVYNISVNIGVGLWAAKHCLDTNKKYHLFLPYLPEVLSEHWYDKQKEDLDRVYKYADALSIIKPTTDDGRGFFDNTVNEHIVENSNFTIVFWDGRKQGHTYDTIEYSFKNNRMVIDGFTMKIVTKEDTERK